MTGLFLKGNFFINHGFDVCLDHSFAVWTEDDKMLFVIALNQYSAASGIEGERLNDFQAFFIAGHIDRARHANSFEDK